MGYRVGYQCFNSMEQAQDFVLSQMPPTILTDGTLLRPVKNGADWSLNGHLVTLSFPECSISGSMFEGALVGAGLLGIFMLLFGIRSIIKLINMISDNNDD